MNDFGSDLRRPNFPKVPICTSGDLVAWAWGCEFHVYSKTTCKRLYRFTESTKIAAVTAAGPHWAIVTDGRQMILRRQDDGEVDESFFIHRRLAAICYGPTGRFLMADKFGDITDFSLDQVRQASEAAAKLVATHASRNPGDAVFNAVNEAAIRAVQAEPLTAEEERRQAEEDILFSTLSGHLATITQAGFVTLTGNDQQPHTFVLASDRDEKIRLTRYPEMHIIESIFCGHQEFVADMAVFQQANGVPMLISVGADMTLRCWTVNDGNEIDKISLSEVPFRLVQMPDSFLVTYCGSPLTTEYKIVDGKPTQQHPQRELPAVPVAISEVVNNAFYWLDLAGNLRVDLSGEIVCAAESTDQKPFFVYHWKHTRGEGAMTPQERRAKRLRGCVTTNNELLDDKIDNAACKKN